ncbi:segregation and condensation protein A [Spirochaeta dissipatitropha]
MEAHEAESMHRFRLPDFEGPLDLLLFLIKKNEVNIYDIPISVITEQYIQFLELATRIDLENITEFYVLAATLLYIKSRMLLPIDDELDEDFEDPRRELVERLIEYQKFKKLSQLMSVQEQENEWVIERKRRQPTLPFDKSDDLWEPLDVWELLQNFTHVISNLTPERILDLYEEVSINEKITLISEILETRTEFLFTDLLIRKSSIMDVVCAFLAVLESVKARKICIFQNKMFGDIQIRKQEAVQEEIEESNYEESQETEA